MRHEIPAIMYNNGPVNERGLPKNNNFKHALNSSISFFFLIK